MASVRKKALLLLKPEQHCLLAEVGTTMIASFEALFGKSHGECCLQELPKLAKSSREVPGSWVTARCQHRWLVIARALLGHDRSRKSALNNDTELWSMLARVTNSVGLVFEGEPYKSCNLMHTCPKCLSMHHPGLDDSTVQHLGR